jgi:ribosome maturation factor RimP
VEQELIKQLSKIAEEAMQELDLFLWGISFTKKGNSNAMLRVFIENEKGVDVDNCAQVSKNMSDLLDESGILEHEYVLEVSSPGYNRQLFTKEQFNKYINEIVLIRLRKEEQNKLQFQGKLLSFDEELIKLQDIDSDKIFEITTRNIKYARLNNPFNINNYDL